MARQGALRVVFVDHSGEPGGGQLGLLRYIQQSNAIAPAIVQLGPGEVFVALEGSCEVVRLSSSERISDHFLLAPKLSATLHRMGPDVIVANSTRAAGVLAMTPRISGTRRILHMRDDLNPVRNSARKRLFMTRVVLPAYDGFIANSAWTLSTLPVSLLGNRPSRVSHPVSGTTDFARAHRDEKVVRFVSLSRLDRWKGIHIMVEAAQRLDAQGYAGAYELVIAGASVHADPTYANELRDSAAALGGSVVFVGHVHDTRELLASAHVLISASISPEPFGQVVVQGLAAGLAVIGTELGGPAEILEGGAGILTAPGDSSDLATAMRSLIDDREALRSLAEKGYARSAKYGDAVTVGAMDTALRELRAPA